MYQKTCNERIPYGRGSIGIELNLPHPDDSFVITCQRKLSMLIRDVLVSLLREFGHRDALWAILMDLLSAPMATTDRNTNGSV